MVKLGLKKIYYRLSGKILTSLKSRRTRRRIRVGLIILVVVVGVLLLIPSGIFNSPSLSILNENWDGCSKLTDVLKSQGMEYRVILSSVKGVNLDEPSTYVILGPTSNYAPSEVMHILQMVEKGGLLILADDFGAGNSVARFYGLKLANKPLYDYENYDKNPSFVVLKNFTNHPIFQGVNEIILNKPTGILYFTDGISLATTSSLSWIDNNENGIFETQNDIVSSFPVMVLTSYGNGYILTISDPSIFINEMIEKADNRIFAINVFNWGKNLTDNPIVYFDESHLGWENKFHPLGIISNIFNVYYLFSESYYTSFVIIAVILIITMSLLRRYKVDLSYVEKGEAKKKEYLSSYIVQVKSLEETLKSDPILPILELERRFRRFLEGLGLERNLNSIFHAKLGSYINFLKNLKRLNVGDNLFKNVRFIEKFLYYLVTRGQDEDPENIYKTYLAVRKIIQIYERRIGE